MKTITTDLIETEYASEPEQWDMVIQARRSLLDLRLGELWGYRDLVMLFVHLDFVSVYKQTILVIGSNFGNSDQK